MRELKKIVGMVEVSVGTKHPHSPHPPHQFNLEFKEYEVCEALSKQISLQSLAIALCTRARLNLCEK